MASMIGSTITTVMSGDRLFVSRDDVVSMLHKESAEVRKNVSEGPASEAVLLLMGNLINALNGLEPTRL